MGSKSKTQKNGKKKETGTAKPPDGKGCAACNFTGEVCRKCGDPITACDCPSFEPVACKACGADAKAATEVPEPEAAGDLAGDVHKSADELAAESLESARATEQPPADYETADQPPGPDDASSMTVTNLHGMQTSEHPPAHDDDKPASDDPELEKLAAESIQRRIKRFKDGTRRRHHTKQLTYRVLAGIIKAGQAAAEGGADGFFGRWTKGDLMAWEALMDAAEWAQEEVNRREFHRMKREAAKAAKANQPEQKATSDA